MPHLERRSDGILVHFDVDVMDIPAADVPHPDGLDSESTFAALSVFVNAPLCAGVVVTELNVEEDADGAYAERLVHGLVASAIFQRLRKLEKLGVIQAHETRVDPRAVGLGVAAFIFVKADERVGSLDTARHLAKLPEVQELHHVAGKIATW